MHVKTYKGLCIFWNFLLTSKGNSPLCNPCDPEHMKLISVFIFSGMKNNLFIKQSDILASARTLCIYF